jgi:hypothetical protein
MRNRHLAAVVAAAAAGLLGLAAGCGSAGGSPPVASAGSSALVPAPSASTVDDPAQIGRELAQCVRDHGIPVKDPVLPIPPGANLATVFGVDPNSVTQAQLDVVQRACAAQIERFQRVALPPPPWGTSDAQKLAFARCVRAHGVPNWPDPVAGSNDFPLQQAGVNRNDPAVQAAVVACQGH